MINSTYAIIIANLARAIGPFDVEKELIAYNKSMQPADATPVEDSQPPAATPDPESQSRPGSQAMRQTGESVFSGAGVTKSRWNAEDAIYERLIIIIPYKSPDLV